MIWKINTWVANFDVAVAVSCVGLTKCHCLFFFDVCASNNHVKRTDWEYFSPSNCFSNLASLLPRFSPALGSILNLDRKYFVSICILPCHFLYRMNSHFEIVFPSSIHMSHTYYTDSQKSLNNYLVVTVFITRSIQMWMCWLIHAHIKLTMNSTATGFANELICYQT